jgi:hypothetical protein
VDEREKILALIPFIVLIGTFSLVAYWMSRQAKTRELLHRERLAMIEKGLMPSNWPPPGESDEVSVRPRYRSIGVVIAALGFGLMLIIGVAAGEGRIGVGIGGAVAVLGLALFVNSYLSPARVRRVAADRPPLIEDRTGD